MWPSRHEPALIDGGAPAAPAAGLPSARRPWFQLLLLVATTAAAYSNTLDAAFHFDDFGVIVDNPALRELALLWPPRGSRWLGDLSFALNLRLGGLEVIGYHLLNLAIHLANGLLVFAVATTLLATPRLSGAATGPLLRRFLPLTAAMLFALHPLATQAVTYVVQRYASLATCFFLSALLLQLRGRLLLQAGGRRSRRAWVLLGLAVLMAAAAMSTKEIALTLPVVVVGCELLLFEGPLGPRLALAAPLSATALLVPLAWLLGGAGPERLVAETARISRTSYLLTQARVVVTYLRLELLPIGQNLDHDVQVSGSLGDPRVLASLALLVSVVAAATWALVASRRAGRAAGQLVFLGTAWLFVTLSVESSIIPIRDVIFEHRMYLPSVGAALALSALLLSALEGLRLGFPPAIQCAALLVLTAAPLGVATWARNRVWKDDVALWTDVVAKSPGKARSHHSLALALVEAGELDRALAEFQVSVRLWPLNPNVLYDFGKAWQLKGDFDEARHMYQRALVLAPGMSQAHNNLGVIFEKSGQPDAAVREYREALRVAPGDAEAKHNLARLQAALRWGPEARPPPRAP